MIIGLCGKRGTGKSYVGSIIKLKGNNIVVKSFASPVKQMAMYVYGLSNAEVTDPILKNKKLDRYPYTTPRHILQQIGTDVARCIDADTWVDFLMRHSDPFYTTVIDDVRFVNELKVCDFTIYIVGDEESTDTHASENGISPDDCDVVIYNSKKPEDKDGFVELVAETYKKALGDYTKKETKEAKEVLRKQILEEN